MNVQGEYIYYMNYIDGTDNQKVGIYRMNLDGSGNKLIYSLNSYSTFINTTSSGVMFRDASLDHAVISLINSDGSDEWYLFEYRFDNSQLDNDSTENLSEGESQGN